MHRHVIVDGSNIATEGRSKPSLAQLNDAVTTFMAEHPDVTVTVIVDATFGHRIDKKERAEFDDAIANNELVAPPAGAIGRGDAFVLGVADKVRAAVLSNDSYQEFHGKYEWLFTEGRLIGGKPVPNVGWVFVERLPVRGPVSRRATASGGKVVPKSLAKAASPSRSVRLSASGPPPVPTVPPPGAVAPGGRHANDPLTFVAFQEAHRVGSTVKGIVESYSSHGATARVGDATCYVPLRLLADPPPRSARDHLKIGETVPLMVAGYRPDRRSIDVGLPALVRAGLRRGATESSRAPEPRAAQSARKSTAQVQRRPAASPAKSVPRTPAKAATKTARKVAAKTAGKTAARPVSKISAKSATQSPAKGPVTPATRTGARPSPGKRVPASRAAPSKKPPTRPAAKPVAKKPAAKKIAKKAGTSAGAPARKKSSSR